MKDIYNIIIIVSIFFLISSCVSRNDSDNPLTPESLINTGTSKLYVNEVYAAGSPDWAEIYNDSDQPISIAGYYISDNFSEPLKQKINSGIVPSKGFLVIDLTAFGLSQQGEQILLSDSTGKAVNGFSFPAQTPEKSFGRFPDGSANLTFMKQTKGRPNDTTFFQPPVDVVINEIYALNPDWIELFNKGNSRVDLSDYYLSDDSTNLTKYKIPSGTFIEPRGFLVFEESQFGFGLSSSGEPVILSNRSANAVDKIIFGLQTAGKSEGRLPDGGQWNKDLTPTKNAPNRR